MKKVLFIAALFVIGMIATAQDKSIGAAGGAAGTSTSVNAYGATASNYIWAWLGGDPYLYTVQVKLADVSAGSTANTASCVLSGSVDGTNYKTITTATYAGAGTDTVIVYNITSAPITYRYLKLAVTPSDSIKVSSKWAFFGPYAH